VAFKHALVDARDLPDLPIVEQHRPVSVLDHLWGTECLVEEAVLPTSDGQSYALASREEARELAGQRRETVALVRAGGVRFLEDEVSVWLGAFLQPAPEDERGLICCCEGEMFLRRVAGAWIFVRWGDVFCA
jgi:hypothetical protein